VTYDEWRGGLNGQVTMWIKRLWSWRGFRLDLHKMVGPDDPDCFHTHPAYAVRLVLWGGYVEERADRCWCAWFPGRIGIVRPSLAHRVGGLFFRYSLSLWLRFPKSAEIELIGDGWARQTTT
jgi:hypothetical protein